MTLASYIWKKKPAPIHLFAGVFFGFAVTGFVLLVGWLLVTSPIKREFHERDGNTYVCTYYREDISCELVGDSHVGGGRISP
jgi:hypothetical protein